MRYTGRRRAAMFAGRLCLAAVAFAGAGVRAAEDAAQLLKHADDIKTANNSDFVAIVQKLAADPSALAREQLTYLHYLQAWQLGYVGDFAGAVPALKAVVDEATEPTLRFRALVSLVNDEVNVRRYEDAYAGLNELLELQPQVADKAARMLGYAVASVLYNGAGQYDLGLAYAERWLAEDGSGVAACKAGSLQVEALFRSGRLAADDARARAALDACEKLGEPVFANRIRAFLANVDLQQGRAAQAIADLRANDAQLQATHSAGMSSTFHSLLARAYLLAGDFGQARQYARSAIDKSIKQEFSEPLIEAYQVLYQVAKKEGDLKAALENHEKFAAADKGYLTDTTARTLAFQMVNQQVLDKKRQIDALNERNQVLQLQEEVASKAAETERLYVALLACGLAFIALWAYRTKRSQIRFQRLSRRDGLTGIINRQHFMDEAKVLLQYCAKSARPASLILVDLDYFKLINDTHGHAAGDAVLKQMVGVSQVLMRSVDLFGRLGGEEFGVLLPDCALAVAQARAEQLRIAIAAIASPGVGTTVSASFGITSTAESGHDLRQMLIHADSALYSAKRHGRNRVEPYVADEALAAATA